MDIDFDGGILPDLKKFNSAPPDMNSLCLKEPPSLKKIVSEKLCSIPEEIAKRIKISQPVKGILKKMEDSKYLNCSSFQNKQKNKKITFDLARNNFAKMDSKDELAHLDLLSQNPFNFSLTF